MDIADSVPVTLHLDRDAPVIHGWASQPRGTAVEFFGWLELSALLDALRNNPGGDSRTEEIR